MAVNLLSVYPEIFAAGAILAGLPFGAATSMPEALGAMAQGRNQTPAQWGDIVRAATRHDGPWPRVSVWHGGADNVVHPLNAESLIGQWSDLHRLTQPPVETVIAGHRHRAWSDREGTSVLESYTIAGMGHGVPISTRGGPGDIGAVGPFHLETGICSTRQIAQFWGLGSPSAPIAANIGMGS